MSPIMSNKSSKVFASYSNEYNFKRAAADTNENAIRTIEVCAGGTVSMKPDRAKVDFVVSTSQGKDTASDAKNSVSRRSDYVMQTLHTHNVKEGDVTKTSSLTRSDGLFHMVTEISVIFTDFTKCQSVCNFLVEKLDDSVHTSPPQFYHAAGSLDSLRRQACMLATQNAHQKAFEMARFLRQSLGPPIVIREMEIKEWEGPTVPTDPSAKLQQTFQQRLTNSICHISTRVFAAFEIHAREKSKETKT